MEGICEQNEMVIRALVREPVQWDGGLGEPDKKVLSLLRRRSVPASPIILAQLLGYGRYEINEVLLRLKRRDLAESVKHGEWVAVQ